MVDRGCLNFSNNLSFVVDERVLAHAPVDRMTPLPDTFEPSNYDVMCGRGKSCFNSIGNRRFRVTIEMNLARYAKATSKLEKSLIVMSIVDTIRDNSPTGGFVKRDRATGRWFEVGDHLAREKVGQALREALAQKRRGSRKEQLPRKKGQSGEVMKARPRQRESYSSLEAIISGIDFQSGTVVL